MTDAITIKVYKIIEKATSSTLPEIDPDRDIKEQVDLNSMQFVAISAAIEKEFDIELPIEVLGVTTFNAFMDILNTELLKKTEQQAVLV